MEKADNRVEINHQIMKMDVETIPKQSSEKQEQLACLVYSNKLKALSMELIQNPASGSIDAMLR